jgi:hypothetical protein
LEHARNIRDRPVLDDLAVPNPVDRKTLSLDLVPGRRDPEQVARVHAFAKDVTDDEIALGDLHPDLVPAGGRLTEHLGRLLDPVAVRRAARKRRVWTIASSATYSSITLQSFESLSSIAWM